MKKTKKGKIIFWIVFIILAITLYFQNVSFFSHQNKLDLDLFVFEFSISPLPMGIFIIGFFLIGFFIAFFFGLFERFRAKKTIQELGMRLGERDKMLDSLKSEVDSLRKREKDTDKVEPAHGETREYDLTGISATKENKT